MTMKFLTSTRFGALPLPMPDPEPAGGGSPPAPAPAPNGGGGAKFYEGWDPAVVAHIEASKYPDPQAIAAADMHARKLIGVPHDQIIKRPAQGYEIDPKPHIAALRVLGAPEKPDAYPADKLFAPVEGLGQLAPEAQKTVAGKFAELGILPWQAQGLMNVFYDLSKGAKGESDAAGAAALKERTDRLDAFKANVGGKFEPMVKAAKAVIAKFDKPLTGDIEQLKAKGHVRADANGVIVLGADGKPQPIGEFEAYLQETGFGNDPRMIELLAKIAERFDPSSLVQDAGRTGDSGGAMSKAQAAEEERKLRADAGFMKQFTTRNGPSHKAAVDRMTELQRIQHS